MGKKIDLDELIAAVEEIAHRISQRSAPDSPSGTFGLPAYYEKAGAQDAIGDVQILLERMKERKPHLGPRQLELIRLIVTLDGGWGSHSSDLAELLRLGETEVSQMLTRLEELELVNPNNTITEEGLRIASASADRP